MSAFVSVVPARNLKQVYTSLFDTLLLMNTTADHFISIGATNEATYCDSVVKQLRNIIRHYIAPRTPFIHIDAHLVLRSPSTCLSEGSTCITHSIAKGAERCLLHMLFLS